TLETTLEFLTFPKEKNNKKINPPSPFLPLKSGFVSKPAVLSWDRDGQSGTESICRSFLIRLTNIDNLFFSFFSFFNSKKPPKRKPNLPKQPKPKLKPPKMKPLKHKPKPSKPKIMQKLPKPKLGLKW